MASSALKSALRFTACMQAVNLKTKLLLRSAGRRRRSVGNCGATPDPRRFGREVTSLSGLSDWPSAGGDGMAASSWRASRTCGTVWAKALRWDIPQSRSLADWRWSMVASSSAMSQSIVSSIIVQLRRIIGIACCRAINSDEDAADARAGAPPASSNNGARSPNGRPRSKAARCRAIGKPTSCCSPDMAKGCLFSTNGKPASTSFSARSIEKPFLPLEPLPADSENFHRRCAKPLASTTEPSSPSITGCTKSSASRPSSAIPTVPGKKAAWKTPSACCDDPCHAKLTSSSSRQPHSSDTSDASTTPHANVWTSRHPPRHSPNSNQSLHFKRESISLLSQGRRTAPPKNILIVEWAKRSVPTLKRRRWARRLRAFAHPTDSSLMRSRQTERHHLLERAFHRRGRKQRQRVDRHRAIVLGAVDGVFQRAVLGHQSDGVIEIAVLDLAALQRPDPERALAVVAAAERQHHRQRDLALAEIVADVLAELGGLAAIIQHIVD